MWTINAWLKEKNDDYFGIILTGFANLAAFVCVYPVHRVDTFVWVHNSWAQSSFVIEIYVNKRQLLYFNIWITEKWSPLTIHPRFKTIHSFVYDNIEILWIDATSYCWMFKNEI